MILLQINTLKDLKPKEQTKFIEDKCNNQSKATIIFNHLFNKRKKIMSELHDSVNYNNLKFKDVSFYEYVDFKKLFNAIKSNQIKFSEVKNKQIVFLKKLNGVKLGKKNGEQKEMIDNLNKFYNSREEVIYFFRDYIEINNRSDK